MAGADQAESTLAYNAFISYSHGSDIRLAEALHSSLHRFAKPWYRLRALRVFRDKTSLSANPALWPAIEAALGSSKYFLLIASPGAARSAWVQKEIVWWLEHRSTDRMLIMLSESDLVWDSAAGDFDWDRTTVLPGALGGRFHDEPLHVDLRWARDEPNLSLRHGRFRDAVLDIAAPLHGRSKDELDGEDVRQHKRAVRLAWASGAALVVLTVASVVGAAIAVQQRHVAVEQRGVAESARAAETQQRKRAEDAAVEAHERRLEAESARVAEGQQRKRAEDAAVEAQKQRDEAIRQRDLAERRGRIALSRQLASQADLSLGRLDLALLLGVEALDAWPTTEARSSLLRALEQSPRLLAFLGRAPELANASGAGGLGFRSSDGSVIVAARDRESTAVIWDKTTGRARESSSNSPGDDRPKRWASSVALAPDGSVVARGYADGTIVVQDTVRGIIVGTPLKAFAQEVGPLAVSADGTIIAAASRGVDGTVLRWRLADRQPVGRPLQTGAVVFSLAVSASGNLIAAGASDNAVHVWDGESNAPRPTLTGHSERVLAVAFSPDGRTLASAGGDRVVRLWNVRDSQPLGAPLAGHTAWVHELAFSADGTLLASGGADKTIRLWSLEKRTALGAPLTGHADAVDFLAFSSDSQRLVSGSHDGTLAMWNTTPKGGRAAPLEGHKERVYGIAFSPDGRYLASTSGDKPEMHLWDMKTGRSLITLPGLGPVAFAPDSVTLASVTVEGIVLWNADTRQSTGPPLVLKDDGAVSLAFSPDGRTLAAGYITGRLQLWDAFTHSALGDPLIAAEGQMRGEGFPGVWSLLFTPDGRTLITGAATGSVMLWDMQHRRRAGTLFPDRAPWPSLALSPDGRILAIADRETTTTTLWDLASRTRIGAPIPARGPVSFSPDGRLLGSSSVEPEVILWDIETRLPLALPLGGHKLSVSALAFHPDGTRLASGSDDGGVTLWNIDAASWREQACRAANRNLTRTEWGRWMNGPYRVTCRELPAAPAESAVASRR